MALRLYGALNYNQNNARDLRSLCANLGETLRPLKLV